MGKTLSVIVPVYFNAPSIAPLFTELKTFEQELAARQVALELIFVNDGSRDNSLAELLKVKRERPASKVLSFTKNFGAVAASKAGFRAATGDAFIVVAADLQDPLSHVLVMVDLWLSGKKFVIGLREEREDPWASKLFSYLYYRVVRWLVIKDFPPTGFDLMLASREFLPYLNSQGPNVNPNLFCYSLGYEPTVTTYKRLKRQHGESRWTFRKKINHFINTLMGFSVAPIRAMTGFGAMVAILGFLYGIWLAISALTLGIAVPGFTTLAVLVTFFSGMILLTLGMLGEYLWRIFDAVNRKPESVIDESFM